MLADAVFSESYRFLRNRAAVFWSTLFFPVLALLLGVAGQYFLKQKMGDLKDADLPPELLRQMAAPDIDLGLALVELASKAANPLLILFVMIGAATLYAGDYRWETWRLISARNTRWNLILGKVGVAKLLSLAAVLLLIAFGFVGKLIEGAIFERGFAFTFGGEQAGQFFLSLLVAYIRVVQVTLIGLLAAIFTRSLLATLFVPLVVSIGQFFLAALIMPQIGWQDTDWYAQALAPNLSADTLIAFIGDNPGGPTAVTAWLAGASLIGWCLVTLGLALWWFQRQDLSKE
jgi:ABC-2 type transport system permease protein